MKCVTLAKASPNQQHGIVHLMKVLENGSFLHESTGLMRLESINEFANIIESPSGIAFKMVIEKVDDFMLKSKLQIVKLFTHLFFRQKTLANYPLGRH